MSEGLYKWKQPRKNGFSLYREEPSEKNIYKVRIDKAIEYIETNKQHIEEYVYHWGSVEDYLDEILDILKGEKNEHTGMV